MTRRRSKRVSRTILALLTASSLSHGDLAGASPPERVEAAELLETIGVPRGICALLGEGLGDLAVDLASRSELVVFVQTSDRADTRAARAAADRAGLLGRRVFIDHGGWSRVHLADNLADAAFLAGSATGDTGVSRAEVDRVVRPRGTVITAAGSRRVPVPNGAGEWTHPYHGSDNNPLSTDQLARAPYWTQFLATPWYGPMPEVTVSSGGRLFKAFGHLAFKRREWPLLGKVLAMSAYNGAILWERDLTPGFMIHRNTIVATPELLYIADNTSCKRIDAATGRLEDEIVVPPELDAGRVWKWMALEGGVLFALIGEEESLHEPQRGQRTATGWPWTKVRETYGAHQGTWGYGRTLFALDVATKRILWSRREEKPIDSRGTCMESGRIFVYSHENFLAAVDAGNGEEIWRNDSAALLEAIGAHERAQTAPLGYATSAYTKANDRVVVFAGPQRKRIVTVSAATGELLWTRDDGNQQLILRDDALYAMGRLSTSQKLDYTSGAVLANLECFRGNCTRATATADSIFARGYRHSGTLRYDLAAGRPRRLPLMRPACQDGVIIANGQLYWGPWMCDCNHSLVGVISLASAGDFDFDGRATDESRLEHGDFELPAVDESTPSEADWPTYRADNERTASSPVALPAEVELGWTVALGDGVRPTAPVTAAERVYVSGSDGIVRALDARSGRRLWKAYTGGDVRYPPALWRGRLFVGSADGWIHAFSATTGESLWRFRAAPLERRIPRYGTLASTWPVASGVLVDDGVLYAAAGIASHDGTHVYALDAVSGRIRWQNSTSGRLTGENDVVGVSVQGHLLLHSGRLYLAGGNVVSPAIYDARDGICLNELDQRPRKSLDDHWKMQRSPRGSELYLVPAEGGAKVITGGPMLYSPPDRGPPSRYLAEDRLVASSDAEIVVSEKSVVRLLRRAESGDVKPLWKETRFADTAAVVLTGNTVLLAGEMRERDGTVPVLAALKRADGSLLWKQRLPGAPMLWGVAVDRTGRVIVTLIDGGVLGYR